jgi:hypothetical protein
MDAHYLPLAAYAGGLALTLILACYLTPARWWHRPTLRNLGIVALGTWCIGALLLQGFGGASVAEAAPVERAATQLDNGMKLGSSPFRVHHALNLRAAPGTSAARLGVIPAGSVVTPTGERNGDWWQVRADMDGKTQTGWASSLWLRRQAE